MFEIDGSQKSGSGTILRLAIALAAIAGQPVHIYNIRQKRPQQGLKPQHLEAVLAAAKLCNAEVEGATRGSREIWFKPQAIRSGNFEAEIGTAGSIPMLLITVLPICAFAKDTVRVHVTNGGTDVTYSPTINYLRNVFLPVLKKMGLYGDITVQKYGYYPRGMGEIIMTVEPSSELKPFRLETFGRLKSVKGVSVCTFLAERKVAERQAKAASVYLAEKGYTADIQIVNDRSNPIQKGSSIALWAETDTGAVLGADAIGQPKKTSEAVGREAAEKLYAELTAKPTVDMHLGDLLIPYIALAESASTFLVRTLSDHLETNIWLAEKILNVRFNVKKVDNLYRIEKGD
ncbi:RNA 3'-terminal phosphate cyclase [Candidatus Bathyarchaeota archaeon A05DMB-2]|nr:RNA 3'-terminal phosphate cyclase [Candidatus Bathyarchaeota archaeon A05DMB-2]